MGNKLYPMRGENSLSWVPGGEKWAAPPVKIAQILTYAPFLRSEKATFARNIDIGTIDTPGTMYKNIKMGENGVEAKSI